MKNFLCKKYNFSKALEALKEGKKIRRASEKKGYAKVEGTSNRFVTYWVGSDKTSRYCIFTVEDVLAEDWIIESKCFL
jgi:hypothetical protein